MTGGVDTGFLALFLDATDLPAAMTLYDRRDGVGDPDDPTFSLHGGRNIGMMKWEGTADSLLRLFIDIRWLFPNPESATAYHLATLKAKSEGKPEVSASENVGDDCHVYSYPSGQVLGAAQGIFSRTLGEQSQVARGIARAIADMPNDAFIFLFTSGPVAVKFFAVLSSSPAARDRGPVAVYKLAGRIAERIDGSYSTGARKAVPWWKRFLNV